MSSGKEILVTGGGGFIGTHLVDALLAQGHTVTVIDNFSSGSRTWVHTPYVIKHDVRKPLPDNKYDQIYHLACPASPVFYQQDGVGTVETNVLGTLNVLQLAERCGATVLITSTSEVYGDPLEHPQTEDYWGNVNCFGPRACYDVGKRCAETLAYEFAQRGVSVRVARIFNTYGPRMRADDGRVVSNFIMQALTRKPLTIYGDGTQTRSFCYVKDTVEGLMKLMNSSVTTPVNIGNPDEHTVLELAKKILDLTGNHAPLEHRGLPRDDPTRRRPDITKAQDLLDWVPTIPLEEGLQQTIDYFTGLLCPV